MNSSLLHHFYGIFLFLLPFSHPLLLWDKNSYFYGTFSPWSSFFLHFQILIILAIILYNFFLITKKKFFIPPQVPLLLILFFLSQVFFALSFKDPVLHILFVTQFFFLALGFSFLQKLSIQWKILGNYFIAAMIIQTIIAFLQIIFQKSIGLTFFGEPHLTNELLGVAKIELKDYTFLRAYGTFAHPNILGFFALIAFILANHLKYKHIQIIFLLTIFFTFSRAVWLALIILLIGKWIPISSHAKKILFYVIPIIIFASLPILVSRISDTASILERYEGILLNLEIFMNNIFGVGIGNSTLLYEKFSNFILFPWEIQPVHNWYLLSFLEFGIIGASLLFYYFFQSWKNAKKWQKTILLSIFILGFFDHYFLSSFQAICLMLFLFMSVQVKKT